MEYYRAYDEPSLLLAPFQFSNGFALGDVHVYRKLVECDIFLGMKDPGEIGDDIQKTERGRSSEVPSVWGQPC